MKKHTLLIVIGAFLLIIGIVFFSMKKNDQVVYYYYETTLSRDEAVSLIADKVRNIINLYENEEKVFNISTQTKTDNLETNDGESSQNNENKSQDEYVLVNNYKEVVDSIYTENGIAELETINFKGNKFVKKNEDNNEVLLLKNIPTDNLYSDCGISVNTVIIKEDSIEANVVLSTNKVDKDNYLTYYVYEKKIKLIKKDDKWLVETFIYSNE